MSRWFEAVGLGLLLAAAGCVNLANYYVPSGLTAEPCLTPCEVRQGTMDRQADVRRLEAEGYVLIGSAEFNASENVSRWSERIGELGTEKQAAVALWYFQFGGMENRTTYQPVTCATWYGTSMTVLPVVDSYEFYHWTAFFFGRRGSAGAAPVRVDAAGNH